MSSNPFDSEEPGLLDVVTRAAGPPGSLPLTSEMLRDLPSGTCSGGARTPGWDGTRRR